MLHSTHIGNPEPCISRVSAGELRASRQSGNIGGESGRKNGVGTDDGVIEEDGIAEEEEEAVSDDAHEVSE